MRAELKVINTKHGLFFISNPNETIQKSLIQRGEFEYHLVSLASTLITNKPGLILDVGANIGGKVTAIRPYIEASFKEVRYIGHWSRELASVPSYLANSTRKPDLILVVRVERSF